MKHQRMDAFDLMIFLLMLALGGIFFVATIIHGDWKWIQELLAGNW